MSARCAQALAVLMVLGASAGAAAAPHEIVIASETLGRRGAALEKEALAFVRRLETVTGLAAGSLRVRTFTDPREALSYLEKGKPTYAIVPPHQFVAARKRLDLEVVGQVVGLEGAEPSFYGVSRADAPAYEHIEARPGLSLVATEIDDLPWLSNVIFETNVRAEKHFKLQRAATTAAAVLDVSAKKADVALVYETEYRDLAQRFGKGGDLVVVYTSAPLPPPPLVVARKAKAKAGAAEVRKLAAGLRKVCEGEGVEICARLAILRMQPGGAEAYKPLVAKYAY